MTLNYNVNLQVNTNGVISFGTDLSSCPCDGLPVNGIAFVAPFWADIDTQRNGRIYYRYEMALLKVQVLH